MRLKRFTISLTIAIVLISTLWAYRVRAGTEAAEFAPEARKIVIIPAGTTIHTVIRTGINSIDHPGDTVTAFVSAPVSVNGEIVIPVESEIKGTLENLSLHGSQVRAALDWTTLVLRQQTVPIQADKVVLKTIAQSETDRLAGALRSLLSASMGLSIGAKSGDQRLITRGLMEGERSSVAVQSEIPIDVVLNQPLTL